MAYNYISIVRIIRLLLFLHLIYLLLWLLFHSIFIQNNIRIQNIKRNSFLIIEFYNFLAEYLIISILNLSIIRSIIFILLLQLQLILKTVIIWYTIIINILVFLLHIIIILLLQFIQIMVDLRIFHLYILVIFHVTLLIYVYKLLIL